MAADSVLVVGAAIVRRGRVLATRRTHPPEASGLWEFPGGKVEPGERPENALVREIREELGCGIPVPHEHDALRWLGPDELEDVAWLRADLPFLDQLREVLQQRSPSDE